ncbi:hypothetical protein Arno162_51 [Pectobacterium phage Arno162]|uniref:TerD domain-containing protein n=1 Tax=Pectobacterium phage Arno162 TaxID=2500577 RepID=A0A678ZJL4_9CAUD|nr:hypothetical protein Arno162_51 [Pectobacterium phage Arno162]
MAIKLSKGDKSVVKKETGAPVQNLTVGVNWGKITAVQKIGLSFVDKMIGKASAAVGAMQAVDLDLTIVTFDKSGNKLAECAFYNKKPFNGYISHSGDDRKGDDEDDGLDNERIQFRGLDVATKTSVQSAFIVLNSYSRQKFDQIPYINLAIYDGLFGLADKAPRLMTFDLTNDSAFKGSEGLILARLDKSAQGWELKAIGQPTDDGSIAALVRRIEREHLN